MGCRMHLITSSPPSEVAKAAFASCTFDVPMSGCSARELLQGVEQINRICQTQRIDLIHAHPFLSMVIAGCVAHLQGLPLAVTLHGPSSFSHFDKNTTSGLLLRSLLRKAGVVFAVSPEVRLLCRMYCTRDVIVLPNAVDQVQGDTSPLQISQWMWAGRLDENKVAGLKDLILFVASLDNVNLDIFGSGTGQSELIEWLGYQGDLSSKVSVMGWHDDLPAQMPKYGVVAGMGRVIVEAAAANRICLLVGYDGIKGFLTESQAKRAASWNFSGRGLRDINKEEFLHQFSGLKAGLSDYNLREWILAERNAQNVWESFLEMTANVDRFQDIRMQILFDVLEYAGDAKDEFWSDNTGFQIIKESFSLIDDNAR
jgi:hypothetical protein